MAKALYRKYRPKTLAEVVGQSQVTDILSNSLKQGKVSHAYLFVGPRGTGKTSVARIFAHEVNGFKYELEDDYVDIVEIDGASNRGIDNIRELREKAMIAPTSGKYKIYIIDEVHMLTKEAFNALLKTLEEPPRHVIFIMATTDAYKVPITITSRAQCYTFKLADHDTMFKHLRKISDQEKIKIDDAALDIIVKRGGGSFRDSLSLLDQISTLSNDEITKEAVTNALGLPEDEKINLLLDKYVSGDLNGITSELKNLLSSGIKPETLAEEIIERVIDSPKPEFLPLLSQLPDIRAPFAEARLLVALTSAGAGPALNAKPTPASMAPALCSKSKPTTSPTPKASVTPSPTITATPKDFNFDGFIERVQELNDAVYSQLIKCEHRFINGELELYPEKKIVKTILSRENNKRILVEASGGVKITIHEVGDIPNGAQKDELLDKFSDIMGGEVKNDAGGNPF